MEKNYIVSEWDLGFMGFDTTQTSLYTQLSHISLKSHFINLNKDIKILFLFNNILSINDVSLILKIDSNIISKIVHREDRNTGLLDNKLIDLVSINPNKYIISDKGKGILNTINEDIKNRTEEHDKQKAHEQTLINEINDLKGVFLNKYNSIIEQTINKGKKWVGFEFKDIARWNYEFSERLLDNPNDTLKQIEIAIESVHGKKIEARIKNLPKSQTIKIGDIRIEHLNKMFYFDGVIKQTSQVKPLVTMTTHSCPVCGEEVVIMQVEHKLIEPSKCACGYKGKQIQKNKSMVDLQVLKLEELPEELCGRTNCQSVSVILKGTLAKSKLQQYYNPGSRIRINGIVKETPIIGKTGSKDVKMNLIIEANYVEPQEKTFTFNPTADELVKIKELSKRKDLMPLLARSFIPTLKDMTDVKIGAMLAIVKGGNAKRDEIHMLICGEPGLAKSEILTYIAKTLPFARYANGASSSSVGLTASVIKDEFTGTWSLNAGTVVMANEGICCVDEIDKMRDEDKNDLNEAAEQGTVTINKAGISGSLQAKTSMIMASNPKNHKFSDDIPYMEQINLPYALLTRFDLLFILRNTDEAMLELFDKILDETTSTLEYLEEDLILKYLLYARKLTPKLCPESVKIIKHKMRGVVEFRKLDTGGFPLSVRQLQGMVRLSTAFAKMRLSEVVEECDVNSAWDLYVSATKTVIHESADIFNSKVN
jgi:replicative DNA helicase Mcm